MKLYCLSGHPNKPCYVFKFKGTTFMLDCSLDVSTIQYFLPLPVVTDGSFDNLKAWIPKDSSTVQSEGELKELCDKVFVDSEPEFGLPQKGMVDYGDIDVILISNYLCMLALPFITEETNFNGTVYATEPTLHMGRLFMEEMVKYIERSPKLHKATRWKQITKSLPPPLNAAYKPHLWKNIYDIKKVNTSLSKITMVAFNEKLDVFGSLKVCAVSSGFCLGSSNWLIMSEYEKVCYVSGSSTLTTHPKQMDQVALKDADILILASLTQTPRVNPDSMLGEFCVTVALTIRNGGNVLVPCYPSGVTYDLFECLSAHLENSVSTQTPMFFISPVSDSSLAYSNIFAEWLSKNKQNKVYFPEEPFPHAQLIKNGRLKHYRCIHDSGFNTEFRQPCIVFCGHPSLRFGDSVHFIKMWGSNPHNTIVFTEPDYPYIEALAPYQPLAMKALHCPIDTSLSFVQANKLIKELHPNTLVLPKCYLSPPAAAFHRTDLMIDTTDTDFNILEVSQGDVIKLPIKRKLEKIELTPEFASSLEPNLIKPGVGLLTVTGQLLVKDNKYSMKPMVSSKSNKMKYLKPKNYFWGQVDVQSFIQKLSEDGIKDAKVQESLGGHIVHLQSEDTIIQIENNSTHIFCGDENLRKKLRDTLLSCLHKF